MSIIQKRKNYHLLFAKRIYTKNKVSNLNNQIQKIYKKKLKKVYPKNKVKNLRVNPENKVNLVKVIILKKNKKKLYSINNRHPKKNNYHL